MNKDKFLKHSKDIRNLDLKKDVAVLNRLRIISSVLTNTLSTGLIYKIDMSVKKLIQYAAMNNDDKVDRLNIVVLDDYDLRRIKKNKKDFNITSFKHGGKYMIANHVDTMFPLVIVSSPKSISAAIYDVEKGLNLTSFAFQRFIFINNLSKKWLSELNRFYSDDWTTIITSKIDTPLFDKDSINNKSAVKATMFNREVTIYNRN